ncbi:PREDICTED: 13S globulin seed storage protein 1-like [Populus euphratica]|uniref:13S globulin seed storage protein 1-like n=1 Tax=Populus euphratica TaxID=75702 RepID=A0AAJ6Y4R2_POPEU|nr:PREDICTED: 13S globulin seed storage protein 1-like [Populus euphratica]
MPHPDMEIVEKMLYNIDDALADVDVRGGGVFKALTAARFPFLEEACLSVNHVKMEANAMYSPSYTVDGTFQVFYVARGTGRVQVVGTGGKRVLDTKIQAGQLLVVPRFFAVAQIADGEGMEFVSILPGTSPAVEEFASKKSVWNPLSPIVSQVSLSVTLEFEEFFRSNMQKTTILVPPTN